MQKNKSKIILIILILGIMSFLAYTTTKAATGDINLEIGPGYLYIGASGNINLGTITSSSETGYVTGNFSVNSFWIDDQKGNNSGYYTIVQASDLVSSTGIISASNVKLKAGTTPNVIGGVNNAEVKIGSGIKNRLEKIDTPMTYFFRKPNTGTGIVGRYGDTPYIEISIPPNQPAGIYTGKIYFTIIAN